MKIRNIGLLTKCMSWISVLKNYLTTNECPIRLFKDSNKKKQSNTKNQSLIATESVRGSRRTRLLSGQLWIIHCKAWYSVHLLHMGICTKTHSLVTYLSTVQVLMFLQEFICLLYCHFIVAIIKVVWGSIGDAVIGSIITAKIKLNILNVFIPINVCLLRDWKGMCNHTITPASSGQLAAKINCQPLC